MDVAAILAQLQEALKKPETCESECQTEISYVDFEKFTWDRSIDILQLCLEDLRNSNRKRKRTTEHNQKQVTLEPVKTPEPLTLQQPPSEPSVKSFETADAIPYTDNISEGFDENENADEEDPDTEDETVIYGAYCPKCEKKASGYTEVRQEFGFKDMRGKKCVQSWCIKCRTGYVKRTGSNESPGSNRTFLPTACTDENRVFDEDVNIINRRGAIFCVSHPPNVNGAANGGMKFHDTIRKASESWKEAEDRHRAKCHPIVQKRGKLMSILAKQEQCSMSAIMQKYEGKTTMELFCKIKQESPGLLKPLGQPSPE